MLATSHFSESQNGFIELPLHALSAHPQAENGAKTFKKDEPAAFLQDIFALLLQDVFEAQLKRYSTLLLSLSSYIQFRYLESFNQVWELRNLISIKRERERSLL